MPVCQLQASFPAATRAGEDWACFSVANARAVDLEILDFVVNPPTGGRYSFLRSADSKSLGHGPLCGSASLAVAPGADVLLVYVSPDRCGPGVAGMILATFAETG